MAELTEGQGGLTALDWCQKEIRNGGFHQLLVNPTGNLVPWAISGFGLIGAEKYRAVLSEIASMLGAEYPESDAARRKALDRLSQAQISRIEELEQEFFSLLNSEEEDLEKYRGKFVVEHPDQFVRQRTKAGIFRTLISSFLKKKKR